MHKMMTIKVVSFLPLVSTAIVIGHARNVHGEGGNLRGPATKKIYDTVHFNGLNIDVSENDVLLREVKKNHDIREMIGKKTGEELIREEGQKDKQLDSQEKGIIVLNETSVDTQHQIHQQSQDHDASNPNNFDSKDQVSELEENDDEVKIELYESEFDGDCVYTFHGEDDLHDSLKTTDVGQHEQCRLTATIVTKSEIHARSLIGDGKCHFDTTHGYWYMAECVVGDDDNERDTTKGEHLPRFVFRKAFCSQGCNLCADSEELPGMNGRPDGPLFRTWGRPAYAVCELPSRVDTEKTVKKKKKKKKRRTKNGATYVQYEGNCIQETCKENFFSTMSNILF